MDGPRDIARGLLGPAYQPLEDFASAAWGILDPRLDLQDFREGGAKISQGVRSGDPVQAASGVGQNLTGLLGVVGGPIVDAATTGSKVLLGMPFIQGPKLSKAEFDDLLKNSKKRKKFTPERKEAYYQNLGAVEAARKARQEFRGPLRPGQVPVDSLVHASSPDKSRIRFRLEDARREATRNAAAERYGLLGSDLPSHAYGGETFEDIAKRIARTKSDSAAISDMAQTPLWSKEFRDEVVSLAGQGFGFAGGAISRANMEAVPRALRKEGWTLRHSSKSNRNNRASSRYLVSPDKSFEIRLSDHYLPDTPQRADRGGVTRWNDEIVLTGRERPEDILSDIKARYAEFLEWTPEEQLQENRRRR